MANPQKEDGHIPIAHEIVEALARVNLSAYESRILWCIFRKTYGWNKKSDRISYSQFEEFTGIDRRHIARTLKLLVERNMIICSGEGQHLEYTFQKDYEQWREVSNTHHELLPKGAMEESRSTIAEGGNSETDDNHCLRGDIPLPKGGELLPKGATKPLPKGANTKERKHLTKALDKRIYGEFRNVFLTDEEYQKLKERFSESGALERIESLSAGIASKGYKYNSHYATILTWKRRDDKRDGGNNGKYQGNSKSCRPVRKPGEYTEPPRIDIGAV